MSVLLSIPALFFFAVRALLIKTPADIILLLTAIAFVLLDLFREESRICRFLRSACCVCMCLLCLAFFSINTIFDISFLVNCAIWLVLLFSPILDNNPCFHSRKIV